MLVPAIVDPAACRLVETGEDVHQGGLAGAGRPHHCGQLTLRYVEGHAAQCVNCRFSLSVTASQVLRGHRGAPERCLDDYWYWNRDGCHAQLLLESVK